MPNVILFSLLVTPLISLKRRYEKYVYEGCESSKFHCKPLIEVVGCVTKYALLRGKRTEIKALFTIVIFEWTGYGKVGYVKNIIVTAIPAPCGLIFTIIITSNMVT